MPPAPDQSSFTPSTQDPAGASSQSAPDSTPAALLAQANSLSPDERLWLMAAVWCSLPAAHPAAPSPAKQRELQSYLDDYAEGRIDTFPWQVVQGLMADESYIKSAKIYSVP